jgi:hypothetical protein
MKLNLEFSVCSECPYSREAGEHTFKTYDCHHPSFDHWGLHLGNDDMIPDWCPIPEAEK